MIMDFSLTNVVLVATELSVFIGFIAPIIGWIKKLAEGTKCQLRSDMLQIYYRYNETEQIPQYQFENFVALYEAYKSLHGNSFIDKIYKDVQGWEVVATTGKRRKSGDA